MGLRGQGQGRIGETRAELCVLEASACLRLVPLSGLWAEVEQPQFITVPQSCGVGQGGVGWAACSGGGSTLPCTTPPRSRPQHLPPSHLFLCLEVHPLRICLLFISVQVQ